ncbi:MAG: helix-turn-helix domain-containing protein [Chitinophagaceae bacterium]|nr:helix-turn-helix domain-containing protein [Chitinophagaceae bacterium]
MQKVEAEENNLLQFPHRHQYYTIIWIEKATGTHQIDFKSYAVSSQTIFFIGPEQVHHLLLKGKPKGRVFLFTNDFLEANGIPQQFLSGLELFFACDEIKPIRLKSSQIPEMKSYADHIFKEFANDQYLKQESIAAWLKLFLIACKRLKAENADLNSPLQNPRSRTVKEFKNLLEKNYARQHKVSDYAKALHLSANYLNEVIKEETGQSIKDLIQNRIILEAKRLATYSDYSMKETSFQLGFDDPSHFSKFFRNCTATDYTTFRNEIRKMYL